MDRLTAQRVNGIKSGYWSPAKKDELVQRLGKYEDTGMEPEKLRKAGKWIPVEEQLPKVNTTYNVTRYIDGRFISDSAYFDGQNTWHSDNRVNHARPYLADVIAWQPLPEPYRPEKER